MSSDDKTLITNVPSMDWISVLQGEPTINQLVVGYDTKYNRIVESVVGRYDGCHIVTVNDKRYSMTHWLPLPESEQDNYMAAQVYNPKYNDFDYVQYELIPDNLYFIGDRESWKGENDGDQISEG